MKCTIVTTAFAGFLLTLSRVYEELFSYIFFGKFHLKILS